MSTLSPMTSGFMLSCKCLVFIIYKIRSLNGICLKFFTNYTYELTEDFPLTFLQNDVHIYKSVFLFNHLAK